MTTIRQKNLPGWILAAAIATLLVALFHFHGVTDVGYDPATATTSLFVWLARRWASYSATQDDFPYGWAAPLVSLFMLWRLRHELARTELRVSWTGFALIVAALLLHWLGAKAQQTRLSIAAFMLLCWAIPLHLCGWRVARAALAPVAFLIFSLQFDFLGGISFRLRSLVAAVSAGLLQGLGVPARAVATTVLPEGGSAIELALLCGGLRSIMLVGAAAFLLAWWRQPGWLRKGALLASVPLVVAVALSGQVVLAGLAGVPKWLLTPPFFHVPALLLLALAHHGINRIGARI